MNRGVYIETLLFFIDVPKNLFDKLASCVL